MEITLEKCNLLDLKSIPSSNYGGQVARDYDFVYAQVLHDGDMYFLHIDKYLESPNSLPITLVKFYVLIFGVL
jgi:hypothetical protein